MLCHVNISVLKASWRYAGGSRHGRYVQVLKTDFCNGTIMFICVQVRQHTVEKENIYMFVIYLATFGQ